MKTKNVLLIILTSLSIILVFQQCKQNGGKYQTIWLHELDISKIDQAAGGAKKNTSMWNTPLSIAGEKFDKGVGTHASGLIWLDLKGSTKHFTAKVGVDDSAPPHELKKASVKFFVYADDQLVWESGLMKAGDKAKKVSLNVEGVKKLKLYSGHADDGIIGDRANWVEAKCKYQDKKPEIITREHEEEYILTPPEPLVPRFNSPSVFGARPGHPFIFTLPVSGIKPIEFTATGLPDGLALNRNNGKVFGIVDNPGEYFVSFNASNQHGTAKKTIRFSIGEKIVLTPPMGWNSWNVYGEEIDQEKIKKAAEAMVKSGLIEYGYSYINIDDGWQGERGGKYNAIMPNDRFPDMKALVDYIHGLGLKAGIYSTPWVQSYAGYTGGSAEQSDGTVTDPGRWHGDYSFHQQDVKQWVEWGFDYLKYDWNPLDTVHCKLMHDALRKSGRDIVYSLSNSAPHHLAEHWAKLSNLWRTTFDIKDSWYSMTSIAFSQGKWSQYAGPGHWNDPDMLVVGHVGWGNPRKTGLSPNEQYMHLSMWAMLAAPMLIGCDMTKLDPFTLNLLKNHEVLAINQDSLGIQGFRLKDVPEDRTEVWTKPLSGGSMALVFCNLDERPHDITISWDELGISGRWKVRDVWKQTDLGIREKEFSIMVPLHGVVMIKLLKD